jgi:3'-5' exonuclease
MQGMKPTLVFSLITVPDVAGLRRLHALPVGLSAEEVVEFAYQRRRANGLGDTLPPHLHRVVHIAGLVSDGHQLQYVTLDGDETSILESFYELLGTVACAVEWSRSAGGDVQLAQPILSSRSLLLQLAGAPQVPVLDLAALLASPSHASGELPLQEMAALAHLPLCQEADPVTVWQAFQDGDLASMEAGNTVRALTVYQLWVRYCLLQGEFDRPDCLAALASLRQILQRSSITCLQTYLADWSAAAD